MRTATDPLPYRPHRLLIAGTSGPGKTTLTGRIATLLGIAQVEIDAPYHGPGWIAREDFVPDVLAFSGEQEWVTEWQYDEVRAVLAERAGQSALRRREMPFDIAANRRQNVRTDMPQPFDKPPRADGANLL